VESLGLALSLSLSGNGGRRSRSLRMSAHGGLLGFKGVANLGCIIRVCVGMRGREFAPVWRRVSGRFGLRELSRMDRGVACSASTRGWTVASKSRWKAVFWVSIPHLVDIL
jgi:hypothetical protein